MTSYVALSLVVLVLHNAAATRDRPAARERPAARDRDSRHLSSDTEVINTLLQNYDKQQPPMLDRPTPVKIGIYINSFYAINEKTMDYSISFYLRQSWRDPRLTFDPSTVPNSKITLDYDSWKQIWLPDVFFRNEKSASFHEVSVPNRLLRLNDTGYLWYVTKVSATLSCPMKLHKYPFDTQMCPAMFESFKYTMDTLRLEWLDSPVEVDPAVQLPQFSLDDVILYDCSQNYTSGAFPCLEIRFMLRRDIGFFLIQYYFPSILLVVLSWAAFWINRDGTSARVALGLLLILALFTLNSGMLTSLPRVSYIKAMDVWTSACLVFVFASLVEFAVVEAYSKRGNRKDEAGNMEADERRAKMDGVAQFMFPLAFLLFNIVYWVVYSLPSPFQ